MGFRNFMDLKKALFWLGLSVVCFIQASCGFYSLSGANVGDAETFQVVRFQNQADLVEPGIDRQFTLALENLILNLSLVTSGGDLRYEGNITEYYVSPMTSTAQSTAAQNRLTIAVNVRFYNNLNPEKDFEKKFSFYFDYPANQQLNGSTLDAAVEQIYDRITQEIFNESLTDW